jgi:hypothetical protein
MLSTQENLFLTVKSNREVKAEGAEPFGRFLRRSLGAQLNPGAIPGNEFSRLREM